MALIHAIRRELAKSLAKRGFFGTLKHAIALLRARLGRMATGPVRIRDAHKDNDAARSRESFDQQFGVDTAGIIRLGTLQIASGNWIHGRSYEPIGGMPDFRSLLAPTGIDMASTTFVDLGSGKGRAILLAARLPFRRVVGVEFSEELNDIAKDNLQRFPARERQCQDVELMLGDAARFVFPEGPLVIYLYNPFEMTVMREVVANLATSFRTTPRPLVVLYFTPLCIGPWRDLDFLKQVGTSEDPAIFMSSQADMR